MKEVFKRVWPGIILFGGLYLVFEGGAGIRLVLAVMGVVVLAYASMKTIEGDDNNAWKKMYEALKADTDKSDPHPPAEKKAVDKKVPSVSYVAKSEEGGSKLPGLEGAFLFHHCLIFPKDRLYGERGEFVHGLPVRKSESEYAFVLSYWETSQAGDIEKQLRERFGMVGLNKEGRYVDYAVSWGRGIEGKCDWLSIEAGKITGFDTSKQIFG